MWFQIQTVAGEYEVPEEEYCQLQLDQWAKFYSCCIQYHEVWQFPLHNNLYIPGPIVKKLSYTSARVSLDFKIDVLQQIYFKTEICVNSAQ